jgi:hypothetical protein
MPLGQFFWDRAGSSTRWMLPIQLLLIFSLVLCSIHDSHAQTTTSGGLTGVVTDASHAIVPDAAVEIKDNTKGTNQSAKTDHDGVYQFFFLAPGRYVLRVTRSGFQEDSRAVNIPLGPPVTANVTLEIAKTGTTVTVMGEAPLVQAENGDFSTTISQKQISEVPNPGNDLTYIAQAAPGVVMSTDIQGGANFSILGMPGTSNLFTINGMNDNDNGPNLSMIGELLLLLGQNQIQEATVVSIGYSGQFGGAAGANVNYITKSGGNQYHGNAQYYWNGRVFNANDWFNNALQLPRPFDIANQWAGSLGGPIKKDKLFFFFDTEGIRVEIPQQFIELVPTPQFEAATLASIDKKFGLNSSSSKFYNQIFSLYDGAPGRRFPIPSNLEDPLGCTGFSDESSGLGIAVPCAVVLAENRGIPNQDSLLSGRVDWNVASNDRVFLQLQYDHGNAPIWTDPFDPNSDALSTQRWWQGQLVEAHAFGSSAANQFLLAGSYNLSSAALRNSAQAHAAFPTTLYYAVGTFSNLGQANSWDSIPVAIAATQYQISDDFVKTHRNHKFGFGGTFQRIYWTNTAYTYNAAGILVPQTLDAFFQGGVDSATPSTDYTILTQSFASQTSQRIAFYNLALYGQDEWHALPNLTLTFALRGEHQSNPVCKSRCFARMSGSFASVSHDPDQPYDQAIMINERQAFQNTDNILWSPRFSFAWQPIGVSHNTVLRGGIGIFYDPLPGTLATTLSSNSPLLNTFTVVGGNLTPNETTSLFKDAAASNAGFLSAFSHGETLAQIQASIPNFSPPGMNVPDSLMHSPQYQRWSFELQQAFGADTTLSIGYFGHHGLHQLVLNSSANAFGFGSLPAGLCTSPPVLPCADPRFSEVTEFNTNAVSNYNGMIVSFQQRFTCWGQGMFQANYTYGHAFDEVSNGGLFSFTSGSSSSPQDPNNLRGSYGPAEYDVRHSFNASYVWELPLKAILRGHGSDYLVKGWQVSGTIFARTGFPYTVFDFGKSGSLVPNNYHGTIYAVPVGNFGPGSSCGKAAAFTNATNPCQPPQALADGTPNPGARFVQSGCETGFNSGHVPGATGPCDGPLVNLAQGRNRFRGPGYFNTDLAIMKNTKLPHWEGGTLGIGFQFFNLFNHPNFGFPINNAADPNLGRIFYMEQPPTGILGAARGGDISMRMIQLKVQIQF